MGAEESPQLKLLIVEDNPHVTRQYKIGLRDVSFDPLYVTDGEEALALYRQWRPDVILLDIMLPGMSGYSILQKIRSEDAKTKVIMVSGLTRREDILACAKLGISGYIVKPFNPKKIGEAIMASLQQERVV